MFTTPAADSSVLALVTTVHLGLATLRNHRRPPGGVVSSLSLVSLLLSVLPWIFPSLPGVALGLAVHGIWFAVCEMFVPRPAPGAVTKAPLPSPTPKARSAATPSPRPTTSLAHFTPVPVLAVLDENDDIKTIRLARPEGFTFLPGQFLTIRLRVDGQELARCYSLSSSPEATGYLEISVRRQGLVSNALHATVRPGALLPIKGPMGAFKYPVDDDRPLVLLAGGIGITPLVSMLRHAVATAPSRPVTLLYSAKTEADFAFSDELQSIARRHPQVRVQLAVSSGAAGPQLFPGQVYPGRIDEALVSATVPDLAHSICFICGPGPMIESMRGLLARMGVPAPQIRFEAFNAAIAASAEAPPRPSRVARGSHYTVDCARTGRQIRIASGQTLLEAAEDAHVPIESLCRAGVCGTCRIQVTAGEVSCASDTLDASEQEHGFVLACVSTATSDCTVEL